MSPKPNQSDRSVHSAPDAKPAPDALDRLRSMRVYPMRGRSLGGDLEVQMNSMKKISQAESAAGEAWATVAPDQIRDCTAVAGFRAGKLVVLVPSAAQRYIVDRWLNSGGLSSLQGLARVPIRGIELKLSADSGSTDSI